MTQSVNHQALLNFVLNEASEKHHKFIIEEIDNDKITRLKYLKVKRKIDVERYLENDMSVGERVEFEELLKKDKKLRRYYNLSKDIDRFIKAMA